MNILKTTSLKYVIAKVIADNGLEEKTLRVNDMIEYGAEALERIGAFLELENKVAGKGGEPLLKVSGYQAELPVDLVDIVQVSYAVEQEGVFYPMRKTSGSYDKVMGRTIQNYDENGDPTDVEVIDEGELSRVSFTKDLIYSTKPGYIVTNMKEGYLMVSYTSIPLDDEGYPLVPDDAGFVDALYWYITMKLLYPKWVSGEIRDGIYQNARMSWNFYSKQAYGNSTMPSGDMLESVKNTWLRLVPELSDHNVNYSTTGERQEIYNQTNNRYAGYYNSRPQRRI